MAWVSNKWRNGAGVRPNTIVDLLANISFEPMSGCGLWLGTCDHDGYPLIKWNGKTVRAARLLWRLKHGPIPEGMEVLHRCDTPPCMNDDHFFLGDSARRAPRIANDAS